MRGREDPAMKIKTRIKAGKGGDDCPTCESTGR